MDRKTVKGTSPNCDKILAVYEKKKDSILICYGDNPEKVLKTTQEKLRKIRATPQTGKYLLIPFDKNTYQTLQNHIKLITEEANYLKEKTNGLINLFRTATTGKTAMQLFYDLCNVKLPENQPEPIDNKESFILMKLKTGPICFGQQTEGMMYKYDVVSEYPSVMIGQSNVPFGKPTYHKFTKEEFKKMDFYKTGLYKVQIFDYNDKVIKYNSENWYTHCELNFIKSELKYRLEIIEDADDEENALIYNKVRQSKTLFKPYVDYLFNLKNQKIKYVKKYLNALHGYFFTKNVFKSKPEYFQNNTIPYAMDIMNLSIDDDISKFCNFDNYQISVYKEKEFFDNDYARIFPFIVAMGRIKIGRYIYYNLDSVVRCHTDGLLCTKELILPPKQNLGNNIGDMKYEGYEFCKIYNTNSYQFGNETHGKQPENVEECLFD